MKDSLIFKAALAIAYPKTRAEFLDDICAGDSATRARIEALMAAHPGDDSTPVFAAADQIPRDAANPILNTIADPLSGEDDEDQIDVSFLQPSAKAGSIGSLGHYQILNILGRGGFGIVFRAFDEKLHRHVAAKVMDPRMAATSPPRK